MSVKEIKAEELRQKGGTAGYVKYMLAVLHEKTKKGVKTNAESRDERCYV